LDFQRLRSYVSADSSTHWVLLACLPDMW